MDEGFYLFSEFRDGDSQAKHFICYNYNLWIWSDGAGGIVKFEFQYQNWRVKYSSGGFSHGSENYIMPMFFLLDQLFTCDPDLLAKLLGIKESYISMIQGQSHASSMQDMRSAS
jgi:hypothetical protein